MSDVKILLVEDESIVAMDMERRLTGLGYSVIAHVMTGEAAIEKAGTLRPDLILMDIHLKGAVDGIEAAEVIKDKNAVPVIYITAYSDEVTLDRAKVTEPFGYILKPFQEREIHSTIEMALYKHRVEQELRRAKEDAEAGNRSKSEFLANVSHELRTPLNSILGMTQMAMETEDQEERREYLEIVQASGEGLLSLIDSILEFSRNESGKIQLNNGEFMLDELMESVVERFRKDFLKRHLEFHLEVDEGSEFQLYGDGDKLEHILNNLIQNALKFTEKGGVNLRMRTEKLDGDNIDVIGIVEDTGCGIAPEDQEKIFSTFYQVDASSTREYNGTGLGLAIVRQMVRLLHGHIEVSSTPEKGARFSFLVKFKGPNRGPSTAVHEADQEFYSSWKNKRGKFLRKISVEMPPELEYHEEETVRHFVREFSHTEKMGNYRDMEKKAQRLRNRGGREINDAVDKQLLRIILAARKKDHEKIRESFFNLKEQLQ